MKSHTNTDANTDDSMENLEKQKDPIYKRPTEYNDLYRLLRTLRSDTKSGLGMNFYNHQRQKALWPWYTNYQNPDNP